MDDLFDRTVCARNAAVQPKPGRADPPEQVFLVARHHGDAGAVDQRVHALGGLFLEVLVAGADPLVQQQDLRREGRGHGEGQAHGHAGGIGAHRHVDELAETRKRCDFGNFLGGLPIGQAVHETAQDDVAPPAGLALHAEPDGEQGRHASLDGHRPGCRLVDAGHDAQQGGLARSVAADQPEPVARLQVNGDRLERLNLRAPAFAGQRGRPGQPAGRLRRGRAGLRRRRRRRRLGAQHGIGQRNLVERQ